MVKLLDSSEWLEVGMGRGIADGKARAEHHGEENGARREEWGLGFMSRGSGAGQMHREEAVEGRRVAIEAMDVARASTAPMMNRERRI